ncbi:hypothetical protein ES703_106164 [subsurface metagenome]
MITPWLLGLMGSIARMIITVIYICTHDYTKNELTIINNARTKENKKEKIDDFLLKP